MNTKQLVWLFFGFSGRISRLVFVLTGLLTMVVLMFLLYRTILAQESGAGANVWDAAFSIAIFVSLWTQAALSAKRIQDFGKTGLFAVLLFLPVVNVVAFIVLCLYPGDGGANAYGERTDSPR